LGNQWEKQLGFRWEILLVSQLGILLDFQWEILLVNLSGFQLEILLVNLLGFQLGNQWVN
jgi:hypothetical protein